MPTLIADLQISLGTSRPYSWLYARATSTAKHHGAWPLAEFDGSAVRCMGSLLSVQQWRGHQRLH